MYGGGHRWELEWELLGSGSCRWRAIVRMSGGVGTQSCFGWETRCDQAPRGRICRVFDWDWDWDWDSDMVVVVESGGEYGSRK